MVKGASSREKKSDYPGGQWPDNFPYVLCGEDDCLTGLPGQDKADMHRHYQRRHPGVEYSHDLLESCTYQDWIEHINEQAPLSGHRHRTRAPPQRKVDLQIPTSETPQTATNVVRLAGSRLKANTAVEPLLCTTESRPTAYPKAAQLTLLTASSDGFDFTQTPYSRHNAVSYESQQHLEKPHCQISLPKTPNSYSKIGSYNSLGMVPPFTIPTDFTTSPFIFDISGVINKGFEAAIETNHRQYSGDSVSPVTLNYQLELHTKPEARASYPFEIDQVAFNCANHQPNPDRLANLQLRASSDPNLEALSDEDFTLPSLHSIDFKMNATPSISKRRRASSSVVLDTPPHLPARKRRNDLACRNNPNFSGWGCYITGCDFVSTGKNTVSGHLTTAHSLGKDQKQLERLEAINNPKPASRLSNSTPAKCDTVKLVGIPDKPLPTQACQPTSLLRSKTTSPDLTSPSPPSAPVISPEHKIIIPKSRVKVSFNHTRLPIYYQCYIEGCLETGRTPGSILKHWKAGENSSNCSNKTHAGYEWDINNVYKTIRKSDKEALVTTHGLDPTLPPAEMLDPKNVKQYFPPLKNTRVTSMRVRSTSSSLDLGTDIWSCSLCDTEIGRLAVIKEHLADCHQLMKVDHNAETKKIHYFAAHTDAKGHKYCHMPKEDGEECGHAANGEILQHLMDAHDLLEDDLLASEKTGNVFLTIAEVQS